MPNRVIAPLTRVPSRRLDVRIRRFRGAVMVATASHAFELHDAAAFLLMSVDGSRTVAELASRLATEYNLSPAEAEADTLELLDQMIEHELLTMVP
ncbi:PqqD family protein [Micromonospora sp. FIMYZ51]|uniref:PqqD family protein n=1 Tax=Micromonospora sp. FIMYZ51 TaxID=3051832 RepID=UPI00311D2EF9